MASATDESTPLVTGATAAALIPEDAGSVCVARARAAAEKQESAAPTSPGARSGDSINRSPAWRRVRAVHKATSEQLLRMRRVRHDALAAEKERAVRAIVERIFSEDDDGELDREEFRDAVSRYCSVELTDDFTNEMFTALDADRSGAIDEAEFLGFMHRIASQRPVGLFAGAHRDLGFICTCLYLLGALLYFILTVLAMEEKILQTGPNPTWRDYTGAGACTVYFLGSGGIMLGTLKTRKLQRDLKVERETGFYTHMLSAGRKLLL